MYIWSVGLLQRLIQYIDMDAADGGSTPKWGGKRIKRVQGHGGTRSATVVSKRKRLTRRKRHKTPQPVNLPEQDLSLRSATSMSEVIPELKLDISPQPGSPVFEFNPEEEGHSVESATIVQSELPTNVMSKKSPTTKPLPKNSYQMKSCNPLVSVQDSLQYQNAADPVASSYCLLKEVKDKFEFFLLHRWHAIIHLDAIHVVLISAQNNVSIQRSIEFSSNGDVKLFVHCQPVDIEPYIQNATEPVALSYATANDFVHRMTKIVNNVRQMEVCSGIDSEDLKAGWQSCPLGKIDENPYKECRYSETFRSFSCVGLVERNAWRCFECMRVVPHLMRRAHSAYKEPHGHSHVRIQAGGKNLNWAAFPP